ncbi:MAG: NADH-quinone oxidoreductase subunit N [Armatimonadota bacterium]
MNFDLFYISPELILMIGGILTLVVGLFTCQGTRLAKPGWISPETVSIAVLAAAGVVSLMLIDAVPSQGISQFGWMISVDGFALFFKIIAVISTIIVILMSMDYFKEIGIHRGEYYSLLIFAVLAISMLAASTDLVMIYLSIEFLSITSYILAGFHKQNEKSNEAAIKYFLYGSIAAAVMIYGMSMLYGLTGTTNILKIAEGGFTSEPQYYPVLLLSAVMILAGLGFKIAMAPFHQWAPDVYEGAPTPVTAFLSVGSKAAGLAVLIRFLTTGLTPSLLDWMPLIVILSVLTMTVGNVIAIVQTNIKRMLAYSSIAQAGYLLIGVAAIPYSRSAIPAILIYVLTYLFMNIGAFAVVSYISSKIHSEDIDEYSGLVKRSPAVAVMMFLFMMSLAGIPPTAGFIGKFYLFAAAINADNPMLLGLAIAAIINTVISVYYYFNVVKEMFFAKPESDEPIKTNLIMNVVFAMTLGMTIVIFLFPQMFIEFAQRCSGMFTGI